MNTFNLHHGNSITELKQYPDNHFDSVVTDPPYLIGFLGKGWDSPDNNLTPVFEECLRVLKPGGHLLSFSAARTYHRLAMQIEEAGFEIRDQLMWLYASGFPKAQDIGKAIQKKIGVEETKAVPKDRQTNSAGFANHGAQDKDAWSQKQVVCTSPEAKKWEGWKTALKPAHEPLVWAQKKISVEHSLALQKATTENIAQQNATTREKNDHEPIVMARKPFKGSCVNNVQEHGTGALNIEATRIQSGAEPRYPSNVIGETDEVTQKYFYSPKVSRGERHIGFGGMRSNIEVARMLGCTNPDGSPYDGSKNVVTPDGQHILVHGLMNELCTQYGKEYIDGLLAGEELNDKTQQTGATANNHPTVKPVMLMRYLVKLVTPKGGIVLDPFNGSGSTGMAALAEGCDYVGCDLDENYIEIARKRISAYRDQGFEITPKPKDNSFNDLFG